MSARGMGVGRSRRTVVRAVWAVLIGCVIVGSLLPAKSPVIAGMGRLHISFKVLHFVGYTALGWMAMMAVRRGRAALAMVRDAAPGDAVFVTGSLFLVAEARALLAGSGSTV